MRLTKTTPLQFSFKKAFSLQVVEAGLSRNNPLLKRPVRTQAVIDQSDMYTHVLSVFTEKKVS